MTYTLSPFLQTCAMTLQDERGRGYVADVPGYGSRARRGSEIARIYEYYILSYKPPLLSSTKRANNYCAVRYIRFYLETYKKRRRRRKNVVLRYCHSMVISWQ